MKPSQSNEQDIEAIEGGGCGSSNKRNTAKRWVDGGRNSRRLSELDFVNLDDKFVRVWWFCLSKVFVLNWFFKAAVLYMVSRMFRVPTSAFY